MARSSAGWCREVREMTQLGQLSEVVIRGAKPDDRSAMEGVFRRASLSNVGDRAALLAHPESLLLTEELVLSGRATVAVSTDGTVVGFVSVRPTADTVLELDDLFVEPEWMRHGIARALIRTVVTRAAQEGVVRLEVTANEHALEFYQAVGFLIDGVLATEFGDGLRMHLDLARPSRS